MRVTKAYRFALDPRPDEAAAFLSHCGGKRFAYNHMLALIKANLSQREAERSYGIAEDDLTSYVSWSAYGLRKAWNARKEDAAPWWSENSKEAYASGCADLAAALGNWHASKLGRRAGGDGFPTSEDTPFPAVVLIHHGCDPGRRRSPPHHAPPDRNHPHL